MPRRIFIGDIHGHYEGLLRLWNLIDPDLKDEIYFVGDLIDRGPQSAQVVDFVRRRAAGCVRGNHEQLLIDTFRDGSIHMAALHAWHYSGGQATLSSYEGSINTLMEHLSWIKALPLYLDLEDIWLVHAGLNPALPINQQSSHDLCWIRETFHSSERPYFDNKLVITGHTITFTFPKVKPGQVVAGMGWYDIDTGAYHPRSGWLTGFDWDNQKVYQANVFDGRLRVRPLSEATTLVQPESIKGRFRDIVPKP